MLWLFCACCPCWAHGKHSYTIYTDKIWEYTPKSVTWVWKALNQLARSYFLSSMTLHARVIFWSTEFHKLQEIHVRWVAQAKTPHHQLESAHLHEWGKPVHRFVFSGLRGTSPRPILCSPRIKNVSAAGCVRAQTRREVRLGSWLLPSVFSKFKSLLTDSLVLCSWAFCPQEQQPPVIQAWASAGWEGGHWFQWPYFPGWPQAIGLGGLEKCSGGVQSIALSKAMVLRLWPASESPESLLKQRLLNSTPRVLT